EDPHRRGSGAGRSHAVLRFHGGSEPAAAGEPVRDQRGLQRDHRLPRRQRVGDLVGGQQRDRHGIAPIFATALAPAARPRCTPPTRYPAANASPAPVASTGSVRTAGYRIPPTSTPSAPSLVIIVAPGTAPTSPISASVPNTRSGPSSPSRAASAG